MNRCYQKYIKECLLFSAYKAVLHATIYKKFLICQKRYHPHYSVFKRSTEV